jgi:(p)ppGpp synthase/HD superfamily hydrolase
MRRIQRRKWRKKSILLLHDQLLQQAMNNNFLIKKGKTMNMLEKAIAIAVTAHAGQCDKAGEPYILHPLRVMFRVNSDAERIVAVLHDVVEDSDWTFEQLHEEGFPDEILEALNSVTKRDGEVYKDFVERAGSNTIGRQVKLADLEDNCDLSRIAQPVEKDYQRIEKYLAALLRLQSTINPGESS